MQTIKAYLGKKQIGFKNYFNSTMVTPVSPSP